MKKLFVPIALMATSAALWADDNKEAYISQNIVTTDGQIITTEVPLHHETGTMDTIPLFGLFARFELWVYPLFEDDNGNREASLQDQEFVGVIPPIRSDFEGVDPDPSQRTRSDWQHTVTFTFEDEPVTNEQVAEPWMGKYRVHKRYLNEEFIGTDEGDENWEEYTMTLSDAVGSSAGSSQIQHLYSGQLIEIHDQAYPPSLAEGDRDAWAGVIEYVIMTDDVADSPIPLTVLRRERIRVWPNWNAEFLNFPSDPVAEMPSDLAVKLTSVYPGTESLTLTYFNDELETGSLAGLAENPLFTVPWSATTDQNTRLDFDFSQETMPTTGSVYVRVSSVMSWGLVESADNFNTLNKFDSVTEEPPVITFGGTDISVRGSVFSLD